MAAIALGIGISKFIPEGNKTSRILGLITGVN
jgi:hypothetical protein